jgi:hypothetical protein
MNAHAAFGQRLRLAVRRESWRVGVGPQCLVGYPSWAYDIGLAVLAADVITATDAGLARRVGRAPRAPGRSGLGIALSVVAHR